VFLWGGCFFGFLVIENGLMLRSFLNDQRLSPFGELLFFGGKENVTKRKPPNYSRPSGNLSITKYNGRSGTHQK
jgi:hypothetical protein